jgi:hypothetical protein
MKMTNIQMFAEINLKVCLLKLNYYAYKPN